MELTKLLTPEVEQNEDGSITFYTGFTYDREIGETDEGVIITITESVDKSAWIIHDDGSLNNYFEAVSFEADPAGYMGMKLTEFEKAFYTPGKTFDIDRMQESKFFKDVAKEYNITVEIGGKMDIETGDASNCYPIVQMVVPKEDCNIRVDYLNSKVKEFVKVLMQLAWF